jgi:aryl carrier-like protein
MEHGAFCSSSIEHRKALRINNSSRVMQFAAYTYDVSMGEILSTLMQGACICIPSEEDRLSRLAIAINKLRADWIFLTPTVAALLEPQDVPHLKTMVLGGEHATVDNFKNWASRLCLINSYGPAECAIWCACNPAVSHTTDSSNIGRPVGALLWVVDPSDPEKLAPIGCVGELVVEGPPLARGYLNDPAKTTATFIENPKWSGGPDTGYRRMYRTGDLVRYNPTGDLVIIGRRDTQVKFHGQRIELGEIEHHIISCSPPEWIPVVHLLDLSRNGRGPTLVTFVHVRNNTATSMISSVATLPINQLRSDLERLLPSYMVPTVYIPVTHLPLTAGGKVDRGALQNIGERLTAEELHLYLLANLVARRPPSTAMEKKLQLLWAKVLNLDANFVGAESNFLRVGGDSVAAMRLSAAAREDLISLDVRDIFRSPRLEDMSRCTRSMSVAPVTQDAQFASLKTHDLSEFLRTVIYPQIPTHPDSIEDVLVATDYQRWVIGCGQLKTKGYNNYFTLRFKGALDLPQLQTACELLLARHPILRTVFITHKRQLFQVVLRHVVPQFIYRPCQDDPVVRRSVLEADMALPVVLGQASIRFILLVYGTSEHELIMRVSHSQYDGISLPILIKDLKAAYLQKNFCTSLPYSAFIYGLSSITRSSEAEEYWRNVLQDSTMTAILAHTRPTYSHAIDTSLKRVVRGLSVLPEEITPATAVKTAWAFTLAQISGCVDVTFGQITTGRNAPIRGIDKVVGPCMNLVPVRVKLNPKISLSGVARGIQSQHLEMSAYEYLGFQGIIDNCTNWPKWTRMSSILQHTNFNVGMNNMDMWGGTEMHLGNFTPDHDVSDIWIWTGPAADGLSVDFTYSSRAIPADTAQEIFERFCENISRISETQDMPASELFLLDAKDLLPLPLPVRNGSDAVLGILTHHSSNMLAAVVQDTWSKVFGDEHNQIPDGISLDTPFYEIRGDLLAASQLSAAYKQRGFTVCEEEVIDNPSRPLQASLLASKQVVE